jgi:outer membrane protein OmpA-like peptidoglycan-associated protein
MDTIKKYGIPLLWSLLGLFPHGVFPQPGYTIERLPVAVNSRYEEIKPVTTSGGDSLFFIRSYSPLNSGGEYAGEDIWLSVFVEGCGWSEATNTFGYPNQPYPDIFIGLSSVGRSLYTLDYEHSGQNRYIHINREDLFYLPSTDTDRQNYIEIEIGNDYHDLYLNPEGIVLFISMNTMNSVGMEDLYVSLLNEDGGWTTPLNLGPIINTRGFEISPFLAEDNHTLYFASNGHNGLGDADIFYSHRLGTGWQNWSEPVNMGPPVNSPRFDAYLYKNRQGELFFSSNRNGKYSDIYKVTLQKEISLEESAEQRVSNLTEDQPIEIEDSELSAPDHPFSLYFEFDEFRLREDQLDRLRKYALDRKNAVDEKLDIYGYTDDTGSDSYNLKLSEKRARFVYRYLNRSGIDAERLYAKGKGIFATPDENKISPEKMRVVMIKSKKIK